MSEVAVQTTVDAADVALVTSAMLAVTINERRKYSDVLRGFKSVRPDEDYCPNGLNTLSEALALCGKITDERRDGPDILHLVNVHRTDGESSFDQRLRGAVYVNERLRFLSLPFPTVVQGAPQWLADDDVRNAKCFLAREGTVINVSYIERKWYIFTNKRFDAFNGKWCQDAHHSFGERLAVAFHRCWKEPFLPEETAREYAERFCDVNLAHGCGYVFLLSPDTTDQMVCRVGLEPVVRLLAVYRNGRHHYDEPVYLTQTCKMANSEAVTFDDLKSLEKAIQSSDPHSATGYVAVTTDGYHTRMHSDRYVELSRVRDNHRDLLSRALSLVCAPGVEAAQLLEQMKNLFPFTRALIPAMQDHYQRILDCYQSLSVDRDWDPQSWMNRALIQLSEPKRVSTSAYKLFIHRLSGRQLKQLFRTHRCLGGRWMTDWKEAVNEQTKPYQIKRLRYDEKNTTIAPLHFPRLTKARHHHTL